MKTGHGGESQLGGQYGLTFNIWMTIVTDCFHSFLALMGVVSDPIGL